MKKNITLNTFMREFHSERSCLEFLIDQKWSTGFTCRRCSHKRFVKGKKWHHKRCASCKYDESATAHTLFHKLKFPIESAFTIVYILSTVKKGMSSCEISRQFNIHQETAWFFKRKVQEAMKRSPSRKLKDNVEADETFMGGFEPG